MRRNCVARTAAPSLSRQLAQIGALNQLGGIRHRRDALRQVERAGTLEGPLLRQSSDSVSDDSEAQPLEQMNVEERLAAAYAGMGLTVGKHPMHCCLGLCCVRSPSLCGKLYSSRITVLFAAEVAVIFDCALK
jgi:DNA polymerase III alpha subunit